MSIDFQFEELGEHREAVAKALEDGERAGIQRRLWSGDASLWTGADEDRWLGWLHVLDDPAETLRALDAALRAIRPERYRSVLLLGMGGSSLCPELLAESFGARPGYPLLRVLDSTVPAQIRSARECIDPADTLFVVSSKSGSTLESNLLMHHFLAEAERSLGAAAAAGHFVAITDPGSALERFAGERGFAAVVHGTPSIGGRFSALSNFGLVPARLLGIDLPDFLERAAQMRRACGPEVPPAANPGVGLGIALATLAARGRDKLTLLCSPAIAALGGWLEQLIAESTGKAEVGILPVEGEGAVAPDRCGEDRVFAYLRAAGPETEALDGYVATLSRAGQPVLRFDLSGPEALGQEFFRWQIATAIAGALLGVHPFDQPDVEAAKRAAGRELERFERGAAPPPRPRLAHGEGLTLCGDAALPSGSVEAVLAAHFERLRPGDYFAIQAFVARDADNQRPLQALRCAVRDARRVATTLGFGPRFLHSTGQLHKGGLDCGLFLQITAEAQPDLPIPGRRASFGALARAQADGDYQVLVERGRRILSVHLEGSVCKALDALGQRVRTVLEGA